MNVVLDCDLDKELITVERSHAAHKVLRFSDVYS
jgi:hypothetical protein